MIQYVHILDLARQYNQVLAENMLRTIFNLPIISNLNIMLIKN